MAEEGYDLSITNRQLEILQRKGKIMSNNFYVYCKEFYPVYEPAEGGYYVECWQLKDIEKHYTLEDAVESLLEGLMDAVERGHEITKGSWKMGFVTDRDGYTWLHMPWFYIDYGQYIGEGFEMGICMNEPNPEDGRYHGYC